MCSTLLMHPILPQWSQYIRNMKQAHNVYEVHLAMNVNETPRPGIGMSSICWLIVRSMWDDIVWCHRIVFIHIRVWSHFSCLQGFLWWQLVGGRKIIVYGLYEKYDSQHISFRWKCSEYHLKNICNLIHCRNRSNPYIDVPQLDSRVLSNTVNISTVRYVNRALCNSHFVRK